MRLTVLLLLLSGCLGEPDSDVQSGADRGLYQGEPVLVRTKTDVVYGLQLPPNLTPIGRVSYAAVDSGDNVYVLDGLGRAVSKFDSTGRFVWQRGGPGEGPGEIGWVNGMAWAGNYLLLANQAGTRLDRLTSEGEWLESRPATGSLIIMGLLSTGEVVAQRPSPGVSADI